MSIPFKNYVNITSGVGGASSVRQRDLIGRMFTTNPLLPTGSILEFTDADSVGVYFGTASEEYLRAVFYFGWVSKNITAPQKISFARWTDVAAAPRIYGRPGAQALATWNAITNGQFIMTLGGVTNTMSALDFSGAANLAAVAGIIQTAVNTKTGTQWTGATVSYDATRQSFNFIGGSTGAAVITVAAGTSGTDIASQLGWLTGAILSNGAAIQTITTVLTASTEISNNFGSFLFLPDLTTPQVIEAATWNDSQNVMFQFCPRVAAADAQTYYDSLKGLSGVSATLTGVAGEYPAQIPMMILAATDYTRRNSVQNYMFQQFSLTPAVTTGTDAAFYDSIRINYYGRTQTAGQFIDFYQRGTMMGLATDPVDQNVYANEQWLKDSAGTAIMALLIALNKVSANTQGRSQLMATLQSVIDLALFNGTISVGKPLGDTQKLFIGQVTGDDLAWHQVQNIGYWLDCVMTPYTTVDSRTEWKAVYTLVYSKDDVVRKVDGSHQLI